MYYSEKTAEVEEKVTLIYNLLKDVSKVRDYPSISSNAKRALGVVWQMVNNLNTKYEQIHDSDD